MRKAEGNENATGETMRYTNEALDKAIDTLVLKDEIRVISRKREMEAKERQSAHRKKRQAKKEKGLTRAEKKLREAMKTSGEMPPQDVKEAPRRRSRGDRGTIEDYLNRRNPPTQNPAVVLRGKLPYLVLDEMAWFSRRDQKYHFHHELEHRLRVMPPEVQHQFRQLLIERLARRNVHHQKYKFIEGTLHALENKYF